MPVQSRHWPRFFPYPSQSCTNSGPCFCKSRETGQFDYTRQFLIVQSGCARSEKYFQMSLTLSNAAQSLWILKQTCKILVQIFSILRAIDRKPCGTAAGLPGARIAVRLIHNLGDHGQPDWDVYRAQGQYSQAEPLYENSLAIQQKIFGQDHPIVARSLNRLALLYKTQSRRGAGEFLRWRP